MPAPQPPEITLKTIPGGIEITRRWLFKPDDLFIGVIGAFLLLFELGAVIYGAFGNLGVFEAIPIVFGPLMLYFSVAHRINATRFSVANGSITIRRGPLPWIGNRTLSSAGVARLAARTEEHRGRKNSWFIYRLVVTLKNGKETTLETCDTEPQAIFLRQELERSLDISPQSS